MAQRAKINHNQLKFEVEKQMGKIRAFRQAAIAVANERFEDSKQEFLAQFNEDIVTAELEAGPDAESGIMPGGYGNLFSYLGFNADENPAAELREFLEESIRLIQTPITKEKTYFFKVEYPSKDELAKQTPMPWGTSKSWLYAIERGVPGFNRYLYDLEREFGETSRSGPAIQTKKALRRGTFTARGYISPLLAAFKRSF